MKQSLLLGAVLLISAPAFADTSLFAEYSAHNGKFENNIDADLKGGAFGISSLPAQGGFFGKLEYLKNSEYSADYYEVSAGGQLNLYNAHNAYLLGTLGAGFGVGSADGFDDTNYFTIPVGLEAGYKFNQNVSAYGGVGYKWAYEIKDNRTLCNDGSRSDSHGSGTCSWHGGVSDYEEYTIGDFDGLTYKVGLRYNF